MSLPRAITQSVENAAGFLSVDHMDDADLDALGEALRGTLRAVVDEQHDRFVAKCGRLPVSYPWPTETGGAA